MLRILAALLLATSSSSWTSAQTPPLDAIMTDIVAGWESFRDPRNGLWCDTINFTNGTTTDICGPANNWYSSAATGMGLISETVFVELGVRSRQEASDRALQTLTTIQASWPREAFSGFFVHWTTAIFDVDSEFSTIDTSEMILGGLFAGNYFGGAVQTVADQVLLLVNFSRLMLHDVRVRSYSRA